MITNENHLQEPIRPKKTYKSFNRVLLMVLTFSLCSFYQGYALIYFGSIPIETARRIYNIHIGKAVAAGLINGCVPVGGLFGAILSSTIIARFSRSNSILITNVAAVIFGSLLYIPNFWVLVVSRLFQGICVGLYATLSPICIKQISPVQISGIMGCFVQIALVVGQFMPYIIVYILKKVTGDIECDSFWVWVFGGTLLTVSLQSLLLIFVFPFQTPKYLLLRGQFQKAKELINKIYLPEHVDQIMEEKRKDVRHLIRQPENEQESLISSQSQIHESVRHDSPAALVVGAGIIFIGQFAGAFAVNIYCGPIASQTLSGQLALLVPSLILFLKAVSSLSTTLLLRRIGRRTTVLFGLPVIMISHISIASGFFVNEHSEHIGQFLIIFGLILFILSYGSTLGPVSWLYISEITSPKNMPWMVMGNWIGASCIIILFPIVQAHVLGDNPAVIFFFFAGCCLLSWGLNFKLMVETRNKAEHQIRSDFQRIKLRCL